jgi:hypothetical protein
MRWRSTQAPDSKSWTRRTSGPGPTKESLAEGLNGYVTFEVPQGSQLWSRLAVRPPPSMGVHGSPRSRLTCGNGLPWTTLDPGRTTCKA